MCDCCMNELITAITAKAEAELKIRIIKEMIEKKKRHARELESIGLGTIDILDGQIGIKELEDVINAK